VGVGLYAGHATQPETTVSMMAICQQRSLCVSLTAWTISRSLGLPVCVGESMSAGCCCNLTPFQHSDRARPSSSDHEIKDDDDSTHQISPILTHITDYKGGDVYDDCAELLN